MLELTERTAARIERVLRAHGRYLDEPDQGGEQADTLALDQPALSACYQGAASGRALHKPEVRVLSAAHSESSACTASSWCFGDGSQGD